MNASKRILLIVVGIVMLVLGAIGVVAGGVIMSMNTSLTDSEGYALSEAYHIQTDSGAFALLVGAPSSEVQLKWVVSTESSKQIFVGWGKSAIMNSYADSYSYATPIYGWNYQARAYSAFLNLTNVQIVNPEKPSVPLSEGIWLDTVETVSTSTVYCSTNNEDRSGVLIVMNTDGSAGVDAKIQLGSKVPLFGWLPFVALPAGLILLIIGIVLIVKKRKPVRT